MKIGNVDIKNRIILAPMAGICDSAFRTICKEMGAGLVVAEMVSDKAIVYNSKKTMDMLYMTDFERPISQQIFGSDVDSIVKSAKYICEMMKPDIIDINMGCPVPKVAISSKAGSALLKDKNKVYEIVSNVVKNVDVPVTVKIRSGWDFNSINAVEIAKTIEKAGAKAITIHPRTRSQGYSGLSDWNIIKQVKENVSIPVIGNGDIKTCYDAKKMIDQTNCDFVMIGRGCLGNPWLIKECVDYIEHGIEPTIVTNQEKIKMLKHHFDLAFKNKPEKLALLELRTHSAWYLKGMPNNAIIKNQIFQTKTKEELFEVIENYMENMV